MEVSMPPVSEAQRRAMYAAASGKSTIGIPQKVGKEFTQADRGGKLPQRKEKFHHGSAPRGGHMENPSRTLKKMPGGEHNC